MASAGRPEETPEERPGIPLARRLVREALVLLFFLGVSVAATWPLARDLTGHTMVGPDPAHDIWSLHWTTGHLLEPARFFHGNIYHPARYSTLYMDFKLGTVVLVAPLRPFVRDAVPLYNLAVLIALTFSGWAFYRLLLDLTRNPWAGVLSGVLATFCSHQMWHVYHLNMIGIGWMPLFWLGLGRLLQGPGWGNALLTGVSFALVAQSSGYYAASSILVALVFAAWHWRKLLQRRVLLAATAAVLLAATLMAPYVVGYSHVREQSGMDRSLDNSEKLAFHPTQDLTSRTYIYRHLVGRGGEHLFPGLLALGLAGLALWKRRPPAGLYLAVTLTLLVLSLGPRLSLGGLEIPLPYRVVFAIPPFSSMRHPHTFAAVATFALAVLAGLGFASLRWSRRPALGMAAALLAVIETLGPGPKLWATPQGLPHAYQIVQTLPPGPVLEIGNNRFHLLWATRHGLPLVNGGGPFGPPYHLSLQRQIRNHWVRDRPRDIDSSKPMGLIGKHLPVRYVIVAVSQKPVLYRLAEALDRSGSFTFVAQSDTGDRIYELCDYHEAN